MRKLTRNVNISEMLAQMSTQRGDRLVIVVIVMLASTGSVPWVGLSQEAWAFRAPTGLLWILSELQHFCFLVGK